MHDGGRCGGHDEGGSSYGLVDLGTITAGVTVGDFAIRIARYDGQAGHQAASAMPINNKLKDFLLP